MARREKLSDLERLFVREYLVDLNAKQAAIRAGYSPRSAPKHATKVYNRPRVKAAIEADMAARAREVEITAERVLREIALMGFANILDYFTPQADGTACVDLSRLTRAEAAGISALQVDEFVTGRGAGGREVKRIRVKLADKPRNLELIGKHLGMFAPQESQERRRREQRWCQTIRH